MKMFMSATCLQIVYKYRHSQDFGGFTTPVKYWKSTKYELFHLNLYMVEQWELFTIFCSALCMQLAACTTLGGFLLALQYESPYYSASSFLYKQIF